MNYSPPLSIDKNYQRGQEHSPIASLYVLKAICAFIVVMIHTPPLESYVDNSILTPFVFIGVPVFYMVTGYFLYHIDQLTVAKRTLKSVGKILVAIILLNLIYLIPLVAKGKFPFHSLKDVVDWVLTGMKVEGVLWYLTALLYALLTLFLVFRLRLGKYVKFYCLFRWEYWLVATLLF